MAGKKGVNPFAKMAKAKGKMKGDGDAMMSKKGLAADIKTDKKIYAKKKK